MCLGNEMSLQELHAVVYNPRESSGGLGGCGVGDWNQPSKYIHPFLDECLVSRNPRKLVVSGDGKKSCPRFYI